MTAPAVFNCGLEYGWLALDGHSLNCAAWCAYDLSALWGTPELRGANILLPGVTGVIARRRRATETRLSLPFGVTGQVDANGTPYTDIYAGLEANLEFLYAYVILPTNVGDGTRELVWHRPSGTTTTVDAHVLGYRPALKPGGLAIGTLELAIPGGDLQL